MLDLTRPAMHLGHLPQAWMRLSRAEADLELCGVGDSQDYNHTRLNLCRICLRTPFESMYMKKSAHGVVLCVARWRLPIPPNQQVSSILRHA